MERVIVWHRWSPTSEPSREAISLGSLWRAAARDRFASADAEVLLELGGTVVFSLPPSQLLRAVELCMVAVRDAERDDSGAGGVSCGIAIGTLEPGESSGSAATGDALDRAQALAHAAGAHEVVLDAAAQSAASSVFLFAREVDLAFGLVGTVLDRVFPRRSDCQRALTHLGRQPFPPNGSAQLEQLRRLAKSHGRHRVLLIGPHGIGIGRWLARIAGEMAPPVWLDVRALGASLAPLSGLMYALRRLPTSASPEHVLSRQDDADPPAQASLLSIRAGRAVSRRDAIVALRHYIARVGEGGRRPLITVDPAPLIDPSTVGVIAEASREGGSAALIVMRLLLESKPPEAFSRGGALAELRVRGLSLHEARTLAASMLVGSAAEDGAQSAPPRVSLRSPRSGSLRARGEAASAGARDAQSAALAQDAPSDLARRAAAMGGANPLAVATALRVLIASGDVVFDPELHLLAGPQASGSPEARGGFRWRRGPAGRLEAMSLEELLEERVDALAAPLRRVLEVLVSVPDPDDRKLAGEVAQGDGLMEETWVRAVEELDVLGLVRFDARGIGLSPALRQVVQATMTPARGLELHGHIANALALQFTGEDDFARATLAQYLAQAGRMSEAATIFLDLASHAGRLGFLRSGVRMAAAAVECDPSAATRARAAEIAERLSEQKPSAAHKPTPKSSTEEGPREQTELREAASSVPDFASQAGARAVQALLARDFEEVDRAIELLVAAGRDTASVDRLRTVTLLLKGDQAGAQALLQRLMESEGALPAGAKQARLSLTGALVSIAGGEVAGALRTCLAAIARTRETRDLAGERAALCVLALCYRGLGREADAQRLARAALSPRPTAQHAHA